MYFLMFQSKFKLTHLFCLENLYINRIVVQ